MCIGFVNDFSLEDRKAMGIDIVIKILTQFHVD